MAFPFKLGLGQALLGAGLLAVGGVAGVAGLRWARAEAAGAIYRDRLVDLSARYEALRSVYNQAVTRTAVTELVVEGESLAVRVRTAEGTLHEIVTPFDPRLEVYVDYAIVDGRVWIRRVFDSATPPGEALVIDPKMAEIDWDLRGAEVGKAVYRSLSDGRWVVSVSGNGSLGLVRLDEGAPEVELVPPPAVSSFEAAKAEADEAAAEIGLGELLRRAVGG